MVKWENNKRIFEEINFFSMICYFIFTFFFLNFHCLVLQNIKKRKNKYERNLNIIKINLKCIYF